MIEVLKSYVLPQDPATSFVPDSVVCIDSEELIQPFFLCEPPEQVRLFIVLFCMSVSIGLWRQHAASYRFYEFFSQSTVAPNTVRGMGYNACKVYGIFQMPRLTLFQWNVVHKILLGSVLLACHPSLAPRFFLFTAMICYFLYFSQVFCESSHGGHGSILMPSVFLLLALSGGPQSTPWSLVFIKIFVGTLYFGAAISKLGCAFMFGMTWGGSTMQGYLFDGMWSRQHRFGIFRSLLRFIFQRWYLCTLMAIAGLGFELVFLPMYLSGSVHLAAAGALIAITFHIGCDILQGLDFMPYWCPVLWAFLPELQAILGGLEARPEDHWMALVAKGYEEEPVRVVLSALYVLAQVLAVCTLKDLTGHEWLPLTCCPMFCIPRNIFGPEIRGGVMMDYNLRQGGLLDCSYNFAPFFQVLPLSEDDLKELPGRVLCFMSSSNYNPMLERFIQPVYRGKELLVCANFPVSEELHRNFLELIRFLEASDIRSWMDAAKATEALDRQAEIRRLFDAGRPVKSLTSK